MRALSVSRDRPCLPAAPGRRAPNPGPPSDAVSLFRISEIEGMPDENQWVKKAAICGYFISLSATFRRIMLSNEIG
jgi:hypothetical protein